MLWVSIKSGYIPLDSMVMSGHFVSFDDDDDDDDDDGHYFVDADLIC